MKLQKGLFTFMAATLIFLILSAILYTVEAQQRHSNISLGSSLTPTTNSSWLSRSGLYAFGFYQQGNGYAVGVFLAGIPEKTLVWTANRDDPPVPSNVNLLLTSDGRLVLQPPQGQDTSIADLSEPASSASMLDTGNFVVYNSNQEIIWQSFEHPTDTLLPGQRLSPDQELFSSTSENNHSTGIFRLKMQLDGNLVQYPVKNPSGKESAYWATSTNTNGENVTLNLNGDGRLYLLNSSVNIYNLTRGESPKEEKIYMAKIDADGIFRLYSYPFNQKSNWSILWSSLEDKCAPKGLCGLNGFCVLNDTNSDCRCLPGFDFVNPSSWSSGCERNFIAESCKNKDGSIKYTMSPLDNTVWLDAAYSVLKLLTREDCREACLQDCSCEAALFKDGQCKKQMLPLIYGRRLPSDSTIAYIKVGTSATIKNGGPVAQPNESNKELRTDILIVSVSLLAFAFVVFTISGVLIYRNRVVAYRKIPENRDVELSEDVAPQAFTYAELEQWTDGFKEELGRGAFGTVYKGIIPYNQKAVAVKRLDKVLSDGEREFQTEIKVIGRTHHRNLVRLIGYCLDGPNRLLVYEYMSNGSLADILFPPENRPSWDERIGFALSIAKGILYLHEECETQIIHCDIKPQNILMDENRRTKISDFGLAKLLKADQTRTFTGIRGTKGYVASEWHRKEPITVKADVYSFGVVLLEIICCRRCLDWNLPQEEAVLEDWVYHCFEERELGKLVGDEEVDMRKLERMVKVGLWCIQDETSLRPSMKKVLLMLEEIIDIPMPPGRKDCSSST